MTSHGVIGIVSGLGPLAGSDVLAKALQYAAASYGCVDDADYPDFVVVSHGIDTFDATGAVGDEFSDALVRVVQQLELHHPSVLGIACNTAHLYLDLVRKQTHAQVVDLIDAVAKVAAEQRVEYLLLSSSTTRATGLYHAALERHGVRYSEVTAEEQLQLDKIVHLVMGDDLDAAVVALDRLIADIGDWRRFDGVIAACTELPLAIDRSTLARTMRVIDSNSVLAHALVDTAFRLSASTAHARS